MSEWEDDSFGSEFYKFKEAPYMIAHMYDDKVFLGIIKPYYDTITTYTNDWNKQRKKIRVENVITAEGTPNNSDFIENNEDMWLDMGARLFKAIKPYALTKTSFLKILKFVGNKSKFDVRYVVEPYSLIKQKVITESKAKKTAK